MASALQVTDEHRIACSDHIIILADHSRDILNFEAITNFAERVELGYEDEQIRRLLTIQQLLGAQTMVPLPIDGFVYKTNKFNFEIKLDALGYIIDAGTFRGLKTPLKPSERLLADRIDSSATSDRMPAHSDKSLQRTATESTALDPHTMDVTSSKPRRKAKDKASDVAPIRSDTLSIPRAHAAMEAGGIFSIGSMFLPTDDVRKNHLPQPEEIDEIRVRQPTALPPIIDGSETLPQPSATEVRVQNTLYRIRRDWMLHCSPRTDITAIFQRALFLQQLQRLLREEWAPPCKLPAGAEDYYIAITLLKYGTLTFALSCSKNPPPIHLPPDIRAQIIET